MRLGNRTYRVRRFKRYYFLKLTAMGMSEYAFGILNWLGNRTYRVRRFKRYYLLKLTPMSMPEYAYGILNWLGNRTYRSVQIIMDLTINKCFCQV